MKTKLEILVKPDNDWSTITVGKDGQPRYESNGSLIGVGIRVMRVTKIIDPPSGFPNTLTFIVDTNNALV